MTGIIDVQISGPNALRIKNERDGVGASRDRGIDDLPNEPGREGVISIFGLGFSKELPRTTTGYVRVGDDNISNSGLISKNAP